MDSPGKYGPGLIGWAADELKSLEKMTRKKLDRYRIRHTKSDRETVCVSIKMRRKDYIQSQNYIRKRQIRNSGLHGRLQTEGTLKHFRKNKT